MDHPSMGGSGGRDLPGFDDDLEAAPALDLDLDLPKPPARAPAAPVRAAAPPPEAPPLELASVPPKPQGTAAAPDPPAEAAPASPPPPAAAPTAPPPPAPSATTKAALLVAKYPPAPAVRLHEPLYACKVFVRQIELRLDLDTLRRKRSPDVALYEEALRVHDAAAFRRGLAVVGAALAVFLVLFFMPVILRFAR